MSSDIDIDRIESTDVECELNEVDKLSDEECTIDIHGLSEEELSEAIEEYEQDEDVFDDITNGHRPGDYTYMQTEYGKIALGELELNPGKRNSYNQRTVGGDVRLDTDDGGHIIGNRFGGSSGYENLFPQDRGLNRGGYKALENEFAEYLENGDKVHVEIATYDANGSERPNDIMVNYDIKDCEGKSHEYYESMMNISAEEQAQWEAIVEEYDDSCKKN